MDGYEGRCEAVVDVTKPAFEGIEGWADDEVGRVGKRVALSFIEDSGYGIVDVGWRTPFGAVDIVAEDDDEVLLVEVASMRLLGKDFGDVPTLAAANAGNAEGKEQQLARMASFYQMSHDSSKPIRCDRLIIAFLSNRHAFINHLQAGFRWEG